MKRRGITRRNLLRLSGLSLAALLPKAVQGSSNIEENLPKQPLRLIGPDGKVVEVDPGNIAKRSNKRLSNKELLEWREGPI